MIDIRARVTVEAQVRPSDVLAPSPTLMVSASSPPLTLVTLVA